MSEYAVPTLDYKLSGDDPLLLGKLQGGTANKQVNKTLEAVLAELSKSIDFNRLYANMGEHDRRPYALRPITLTDEEVAELDDIKRRPSPLIGRHLRSIPDK
ncbi:MAG TPA: hypothetical protein VGF98_10895 [Candidatus Tumulicola sp.]|jgi:hypothetical protein